MISQQVEIHVHSIKQVDVSFITCKNQENVVLKSNLQGSELNKFNHETLSISQCLAQIIVDHLVTEQYVNNKI